MDKSPVFTLLMPVLNRREAIVSALESVRSQTFRDFELLIVDNGSSDGTYEYCQALNEEWIRLYQCKAPGLAFARNTGIREAQGDWIVLLDSDNRLLQETTLAEIATLTEKQPKYDLFFTRSQDTNGNVISTSPTYNRKIDLAFYTAKMNGEFAPIIKKSWFLNNLYPEIVGARTEFPDSVWMKAVLTQKAYLSELTTQIYSTDEDNRICSPQVTNDRARELSHYYRMILRDFGDALRHQCGFTIHSRYLLRFAIYNRLANEFEDTSDILPDWLIFTVNLLPKEILRRTIEFKKRSIN